jgi:REP-associated tyrosine transposase
VGPALILSKRSWPTRGRAAIYGRVKALIYQRGLLARAGRKIPQPTVQNSQTECAYVTDTTLPNSYDLAEMPFHRTFFVTTVTWQRTSLFRNPQKAELMMAVLEHYREQKKYALHQFVIMPDHLHLLLTPAAGISLERAVQLIKGGFSYRLGKAKRGLVWQESFTNHRIHDEQDYGRHAEYIRMNPVRARLTERPELYPYSSAGMRSQTAVLDRAI